MLLQIGEHIYGLPTEGVPPEQRGVLAKDIGTKAAGLAVLPKGWTPPFLVVSCDLYGRWRAAEVSARDAVLAPVAAMIADYCTRHWTAWTWGLALRSSASNETLNERGAFESRELPADFDADAIHRIMAIIYEDFQRGDALGEIAVVIQARVKPTITGHLSNERRVSKTINQWMWEADNLQSGQGRFNSQRSVPPLESSALAVSAVEERHILGHLKQVARWCTELNSGTTHIEWGVGHNRLWIFQLDFEADQPDLGSDPRELLRSTDTSATGLPLVDSPFRAVGHTEVTGWPKIDKVADFLVGRTDPFPQLFFATGDAIQQAALEKRDLAADVEAVAVGRAVCRTDCVSKAIPRLNLPRTHTVSSETAVEFMLATLKLLSERGATPEDICFILHKFIPARTAAWAMSRPNNQIVLVDALWGLPDGLQYLPHDTFEFDVRRDAISAEQIRYKPRFLQEMPNGHWSLVPIARALARSRSLGLQDLRQVASDTHAIALRAGKPVQVMWFCDVAEQTRAGRNVPWFMMDAVEADTKETLLGPRMPRVVVRGMKDLRTFDESGRINCILQLEPDAELFRDDSFIDSVVDAAKRRACAVELLGSILSHPYYVLERAGVNVITSSANRARVRQRKTFGKLVRDQIPDQIRGQGERVAIAQIPKSESRVALAIKLHEECQELLKAESPQEVTGELADLLEVLRSLSVATGVDWNEVQAAAETKRLSRGSFEKNVVLLETSWPGWTARPEPGQIPTISVRKLAHVAQHDNGHQTLSYASVLVKDAPNVVRLHDGKQISVRLSASGVEIGEVEELVSPEVRQMKFDF